MPRPTGRVAGHQHERALVHCLGEAQLEEDVVRCGARAQHTDDDVRAGHPLLEDLREGMPGEVELIGSEGGDPSAFEDLADACARRTETGDVMNALSPEERLPLGVVPACSCNRLVPLMMPPAVSDHLLDSTPSGDYTSHRNATGTEPAVNSASISARVLIKIGYSGRRSRSRSREDFDAPRRWRRFNVPSLARPRLLDARHRPSERCGRAPAAVARHLREAGAAHARVPRRLEGQGSDGSGRPARRGVEGPLAARSPTASSGPG